MECRQGLLIGGSAAGSRRPVPLEPVSIYRRPFLSRRVRGLGKIPDHAESVQRMWKSRRKRNVHDRASSGSQSRAIP